MIVWFPSVEGHCYASGELSHIDLDVFASFNANRRYPDFRVQAGWTIELDFDDEK